mmetsp:Transcript_4570/g.11064  ORF Transcript_4570/g.11064 Transcript_4570/m.11064 type:complete len:240 (-) Transcript_4570:503-1222(-)
MRTVSRPTRLLETPLTPQGHLLAAIANRRGTACPRRPVWPMGVVASGAEGRARTGFAAREQWLLIQGICCALKAAFARWGATLCSAAVPFPRGFRSLHSGFQAAVSVYPSQLSQGLRIPHGMVLRRAARAAMLPLSPGTRLSAGCLKVASTVSASLLRGGLHPRRSPVPFSLLLPETALGGAPPVLTSNVPFLCFSVAPISAVTLPARTVLASMASAELVAGAPVPPSLTVMAAPMQVT